MFDSRAGSGGYCQIYWNLVSNLIHCSGYAQIVCTIIIKVHRRKHQHSEKRSNSATVLSTFNLIHSLGENTGNYQIRNFNLPPTNRVSALGAQNMHEVCRRF